MFNLPNMHSLLSAFCVLSIVVSGALGQVDSDPLVEWCGSPSLVRQAHAVGFGIAMQRVLGMISISFWA